MDKTAFRPIDLARAAGISAQSVRQYEALGFLPAAKRSATGYRRYGPRHLRAMKTARLLVAGYGWGRARAIMHLMHEGNVDAALVAVDASHADLHRQRSELEATLQALRNAAVLPSLQRVAARRPRWRHDLQVGEVARHVGVRVSTVRFWEAQGLLSPRRDPESGYRLYDAEQLRRSQIVALLRKGGYGLPAIQTVLAELASGNLDMAVAAAEKRLTELIEASRRACAATAALWAYLQDGKE
jgi:DNA-binding transcriptional MerR regulator